MIKIISEITVKKNRSYVHRLFYKRLEIGCCQNQINITHNVSAGNIVKWLDFALFLLNKAGRSKNERSA